MRILPIALLFAACERQVASTPSVAAPGPAPTAATAPTSGVAGDAVVAYWKDGGKVTYGELQADMKMQLAKMEADYLRDRYDAESDAVDEKIQQALLAAEAKANGLTDADALLKKEVEAKVTAPSDAEVNEAWTVLQRKFRGKQLEEVRPDVEKAVLQKKQGERYQAYIAELKAKYGAVVQLPYPNLPRIDVAVDDDPSLGPADAPITIVQFADYQCPYCGKAQDSVDQVMKTYEGKVRFVFRDFPLSFHQSATPAAIAANCAGQQEKFWPVHDAIMRDQKALSDADLQRIATEAGVDLGKWNICRQDPAVAQEISKDEKDGAAAGVTGTPAFFINGLFLNGAQPYEKFKAIIDSELAKQG